VVHGTLQGVEIAKAWLDNENFINCGLWVYDFMMQLKVRLHSMHFKDFSKKCTTNSRIISSFGQGTEKMIAFLGLISKFI